MRKLKEINEVIKELEEYILEEDSKILANMTGSDLYLDEKESRGARKALIWATKVIQKKKDIKPNKKLNEFGIQNPIKMGVDFGGKDRTIISK